MWIERNNPHLIPRLHQFIRQRHHVGGRAAGLGWKDVSGKEYFHTVSKMFFIFTAIVLQAYLSATIFFAFARSRSANDGSFNIINILAAISLGSCVQKRPVSPSFKKSGMPPTAVATTGRPAAMASKNETPNPSDMLGRQKISAACK